jgi:hypothetical protein
VAPASAGWSESTLTWSNRPLPGSTAGTLNINAASNNNDVDVDVTAAVRSWVTAATPNNGFVLSHTGLAALQFASKEHGAVPGPRLIVTTTRPNGGSALIPDVNFFNLGSISAVWSQTCTNANQSETVLGEVRFYDRFGNILIDSGGSSGGRIQAYHFDDYSEPASGASLTFKLFPNRSILIVLNPFNLPITEFNGYASVRYRYENPNAMQSPSMVCSGEFQGIGPNYRNIRTVAANAGLPF